MGIRLLVLDLFSISLKTLGPFRQTQKQPPIPAVDAGGHYRYMNTSCRGENNVASLLKSAQSIFFFFFYRVLPLSLFFHHLPLAAIYYLTFPQHYPTLFITLP